MRSWGNSEQIKLIYPSPTQRHTDKATQNFNRFLYRCKTVRRTGYRLRAIRRIMEIRGRKLHQEDFKICTLQIKENEMGGTGTMHAGVTRKACKVLVKRTWRKQTIWNPCIGDRMILKRILKKLDGRVGNAINESGFGTVVSSCEYGIEDLGYVRRWLLCLANCFVVLIMVY